MRIDSFICDVRKDVFLADHIKINIRVKMEGISGKVYGSSRIVDRRHLHDHKSLLAELFDDCRRQIEHYITADNVASLTELGRHV